MCLSQSKTPAVYQRPDPKLTYQDGNVFDPLPEPEPTTTDTSSTNNNNGNNDPYGHNSGNVLISGSGLNIPSSNLTIGITDNSTIV